MGCTYPKKVPALHVQGVLQRTTKRTQQ